MILFGDTETTGKADLKGDAWAPHQPRIVQLAALLCDDDGKEIQSLNLIIRPDGYTIPPEASSIHGITHEFAEKCGISIKAAMNTFEWLWKAADKFVAHNVQFDAFMLSGEMIRAFEDDLPERERFCTMLATTNVCCIPGPYGNKWPKLIEAYQHCFGKSFDGAHDALADVRACKEIYFWLQNERAKNQCNSEL